MAPDLRRTRRAERRLRLAEASAGEDASASPSPLDPGSAALVAGSPDGIAVLDADGVIVDWNPAAERLLGRERELALGEELASLIFPPHLQEAVRAVLLRELTEPGEGFGQRQIELAAIRGDGREIPVDITATAIATQEQPLLAIYLRDATERSERERELHADARRRSAVLDFGQVALEGMPLQNLLKRALDLAMEELRVTRCEIWRRGEEDGTLEFEAGIGWDEPLPTTIPLSTNNQPGYTLLRGQGAIVVEDFRREGRFSPIGPIDSEPMQSAISVRIPGGQGGFGVLVVSSAEIRRFELSDISLLESLAQMLGAAIERTIVNDELADAERRIRTLVERLPSITYRAGLGTEGEWLFISPQVEEVLGYTIDEWLNHDEVWEQAIHPDDLERVMAEEEACAKENRPLDIEYRIRRKDGEMIWVRDRASLGELDEEGVMVVEGLITDISDQKAAEERLRYLASHDELTGLLNRRSFEVAVDELMGSERLAGARGAMILVDIDHLKRVNDTLGRSTGDRVIIEIGRLIDDEISPGNLLGRLDSDEFGIFVPGVGAAQAQERANSILAAIRRRPGAAALTASIGVALVDRGMGVSATDLLTAADIALHQAKEGGRDRTVVFTGEDRSKLEWVGHVRKSVEEEKLVLFSQPIVDLRTGKQWASELLVRMLDPNTGKPINAGDFVPTAERFGLIRNLDRWVVKQALGLIEKGHHVSANISAASIGDLGITDLVRDALEASGADPSLLTFEITETAATPAIESLTDFTGRVQRLGCGLSLDDVGTGFGSLTYLRHLPFTELKIDMQFVHGMRESEADARIIGSLVDIARGLGMRTVAEGVDDPALVEALRDLGVDYAQGYLFGRPALVEA